MFDETEARKRFATLGKQRDAILAKSGPLRAARDTLVAASQPKERALHKQIVAAEQGLYDIDMERGALARALKGKTSEPAPDKAA